MNGWRVGLGLLLAALLGIPVCLPLLTVFTQGSFDPWADLPRLSRLAGATLLLVGGVWLLALPVGVAQAVMLFRTNLPLRRVFLFANFLLLAMPLPLHVMGWQAFLGPGGWLALATNAPGRPWIEGLGPAVLIHAAAAVPWVVLIVGVGLRGVERELEEEALLCGNPWHVLWTATLPRCRGSIFVAAVLTALTVMNDVAVTDMLLVDTFAEEIHTAFVQGDGRNLARALGLSVPVLGLTWLVLVNGRATLERALPPAMGSGATPRLFLLRWRWPWLAVAGLFMLGVVLVPTCGLLDRLGRTGPPPVWSATEAGHFQWAALQLHGGQLAVTVVSAVGAGLLAASLALAAAWLMADGPWFRTGTWALAALLWAMPGPAVGIGLKEVILSIRDWFPDSLCTWLLYHTSPTPLLWAHVLRFFPCALAILWPIVRMIPRDLRETARLYGSGARQEFWWAIWPGAWRAWLAAILVVAVLSLGEIGASARVDTPGWESFAKLLFDRMHYGLANAVAALGFILLGSLAAAVGVVSWVVRKWI